MSDAPSGQVTVLAEAAEATVTRRVSERVRALRAQRQWSARELAEACAREGMPSLNRSTIAKIESGARKGITADEIAVLARALGVRPEILMSEDEGTVTGLLTKGVMPGLVPEAWQRDLPFNEVEIGLLLRTLARVYNSEERAVEFLRSIRFPSELIPAWSIDGTAIGFWGQIFEELDRGVMMAPYRRLLDAAVAAYGPNPVLSDLAGKYRSLEAPEAVPRLEAPERDLPLTRDDIVLLRHELSRLFDTEDRVLSFLRSIRFPSELIPAWSIDGTAIGFWGQIFEELDRGVMVAPYRRLLDAAVDIYASNPVLSELSQKYSSVQVPGSVGGPPMNSSLDGEPAEESGSRLVAWVNAKEREALEAWLTKQGLDPQPQWLTSTSASYTVNEADPRVVERLMRGRPDINWTVVAPGEPDYVLRYLSVQGPDGRSFRFNDVPSATPVGVVAGELVDQYTDGMPDGDQPTVVEYVGPDGPRQISPDSTLAEEGVAEGSRIRVGFERRFNPFYPIVPRNWPSAGEDRAVASTNPPSMQLTERKPHPFLTVVQLFAANASAVLELHLGYYVYYWRAEIRAEDFVRAIQQREGRSDLTFSLVWDSGEVEQRRAEEVIDIAVGRVVPTNSRSALIRYTGQNHSWVWQPGPLDVAEPPSGGQRTAYVVQASTANHTTNFRVASEFLSVSAVDGKQLARSTHLLEGYLNHWLEDSGTEVAATLARS